MADYPKVKIVRSNKREGLIRARMLGHYHAIGPVETFIDSHIEVTEGWLEPLLNRIARDRTTVVVPIIDSIDADTFKYNFDKNGSICIGGFNWKLGFTWIPPSVSEKARRSDISQPIKFPTMSGGFFSIDKEFFEKLGLYDPGEFYCRYVEFSRMINYLFCGIFDKKVFKCGEGKTWKFLSRFGCAEVR